MTNKIMILGVANSGKSTLFNHLQEKYSPTGNYPHTTTSIVQNEIKISNKTYTLIDTPAINSLETLSEDEIAVRDLIIDAETDIIVQCIDSGNIRRSLILTAQLMEWGIPMIICLNFADEARRKGIRVDSRKMEKVFGIPVLETVAHEGQGIDELISRIKEASAPKRLMDYPRVVMEYLGELDKVFASSPPPNLPRQEGGINKKTEEKVESTLLPRGFLLMVAAEPTKDALGIIADKFGKDAVKKALQLYKKTGKSRRMMIRRMILDARTRWADNFSHEVTSITEQRIGKMHETIGHIVRHPIWGWPVLLGILYLAYLLVGKVGTVYIAGGLDQQIFAPLTELIAIIIPSQFLKDFLVGDYGILTLGLFTAFGTVLPILTMFFIILSIMEETGYITNLCVLTDNILKKVGLGGKSILPIALGFGCKTMATLTTTMLDTWRERYITIFLIAFTIPCSAQLGLLLAILAYFPFSATVAVFSVLIGMEIIAAILLNKIINKETQSDFIMEIPPMRMPDINNVAIKVYYRMTHFIKEAVPLFLLGALILFSMEKLGILYLIQKLMSPIVETFLALPIKSLEGFILCLVRHEQGAAVLLEMAKAGQFSYISVIVVIVVITGFIPCIPNIAAIGKRLGMIHAGIMTLVITSAAIITGGVLNWALRLVFQGHV
ncbi:ferrous iron transport protein B [Elusimicrobiota bacterium]